MSGPKEQQMVVSNDQSLTPNLAISVSASYREEIIQTIDNYREKIKNQRMDRNKIQSRLKLLKMREEASGNEDLSDIEKELWRMAVDIEEPSLRMQRSISMIVFLYSLFAFCSFILLIVSNSIMLPSFNIPYTVLLMGLLGSLLSMYVKLPNIRISEPLSYDQKVWFIISPPIAVIMAGIFYGIIQIFLPVIPFDLADESWPFWFLAWFVGMNNWVSFYEWLGRKFRNSGKRHKLVKTEKVKVIQKEKQT
jgi:hypothetical protein